MSRRFPTASIRRSGRERFTFDQNHTYIPATALTAAALALLGDVPEADNWLKHAYAAMRRCRYTLGDDGYYFEGDGYWSYALHWHVRYADLIARATGEKALNLPALRDGWKFPLYLSLPGGPYAFDIGDAGRWTGAKRTNVSPNNFDMLWDEASVLRSGAARAAADLCQAHKAEQRLSVRGLPVVRSDGAADAARSDQALLPFHRPRRYRLALGLGRGRHLLSVPLRSG